MKKAIVTVDLGFGDSGKGSIVDFLCRTQPIDLVIRYSGGAQCGHNVVTPDRKHHCFSQYGSGTLTGVPTYLDREVIVNPLSLCNEFEHLKQLCDVPRIAVHPSCLVTTFYHQAMNKHLENNRGIYRHGSCGMGIGETRSYWLKYGEDAIFVTDLLNKNVLYEKLNLLRQRLLLESDSQALFTHPRTVCDDLFNSQFANLVSIAYDKPKHNFAVFEAAQGVLLDENFGFPPNTTWSTVTDFFADVSDYNMVNRLGIIRSYHTRHGAGPLPSYDQSLTDRVLKTDHNCYNEWQGNFRCGWFDINLFGYALSVNPVDAVAVNCLDQSSNYMTVKANIIKYKGVKEGNVFKNKLENVLNYQSYYTNVLEEIQKVTKVVIAGYGPTYKDKVYL